MSGSWSALTEFRELWFPSPRLRLPELGGQVSALYPEKLILDGRIHPTRIEEVVDKAKQAVELAIEHLALGPRDAEPGVGVTHRCVEPDHGSARRRQRKTPKSTWASSPGSHSKRQTRWGALALSLCT